MKLADWLKKEKVTPDWFGEQVGVSARTIRRYMHGDRFPRALVLAKIRAVTKGAVTANDFVADREEFLVDAG